MELTFAFAFAEQSRLCVVEREGVFSQIEKCALFTIDHFLNMKASGFWGGVQGAVLRVISSAHDSQNIFSVLILTTAKYI